MPQRSARAHPPRVQHNRSSRPRRPTTAPSRNRSEIGGQVAGYVLRYAANRYIEQQRHRHLNRSRRAHGGSLFGHAVTNVLLEELIQEAIEYLVRHNFFMGNSRRRDPNGQEDPRPDAGSGRGRQNDDDDGGHEAPSQQSSQSSSTEQRRRHRHRRRGEAMMTSLDRLSNELETTYEAVVRALGDSTGSQNEATVVINEPLRTNAEDLRRAITRCMARIESVRRYHPDGSRRRSRHRGSGRSGQLSRSGSENIRRA